MGKTYGNEGQREGSFVKMRRTGPTETTGVEKELGEDRPHLDEDYPDGSGYVSELEA